jgi:cytochrome P450
MQDTTVPLQFWIKDKKTGKEIREIVIYKGTPVYVGLGATNRSAALWGADVAEFKPERWMGRQAHESTVEQIKTPGVFSNM